MLDTLVSGSGIWLLSIGLPLLAAALLTLPSLRRHAMAVAPWTAAPALVLALAVEPDQFVDVGWLLLGTRLGLDATGRVFLCLTAALWIVCGVYARASTARDPGAHHFLVFFLVSMAGNLGVVIAGDMLTFYFCFALMSFASYGLIVHERNAESLRAGRVYIAFVVGGEVLLFAGIVGAAAFAEDVSFSSLRSAFAGSSMPGWIPALLFLGFAVKTAAVPLHLWLPLAYRAAPVPGSAVLSGPMIKAGLLGWLRFLPLGAGALPALGLVCVIGGFVSAFWGVVVGLAQKDPKAALGYSSVSQMGLMTVGIGAGLLAPAAWPLILPALLLYAVHHALAKASLFLGVGVAGTGASRWLRRAVVAGLALPALSLAGLPLTSGAAAKVALKKGLELAPLRADFVDFALSLAAVGTTLLMARFLALAWPREQEAPPLTSGAWLAWIVLLAGVAGWVWLPWAGFAGAAAESLTPAYLWSALWPPAVGVGLAWWASRAAGVSNMASRIHVPAGDILSPLMRALNGAGRLLAEVDWPFRRSRPQPSADEGESVLSWYATRMEEHLQSWNVVGVLVLTLTAALLLLLS